MYSNISLFLLRQPVGREAVIFQNWRMLGFEWDPLTLVGLGCQNYVKAWEGGRSALPLKNSKIRLKTTFFKVCHCLHYIKIIVKVGLAKEKCLKKNLWRKNPRGGRSAPPRPTRVNFLLWLACFYNPGQSLFVPAGGKVCSQLMVSKDDGIFI